MEAPANRCHLEENLMIPARRLQFRFADGFMYEQVDDFWEPWMRHANQALNDVRLLEINAGLVEQAVQKEQDARSSRHPGRDHSPPSAAPTYSRLEL